MLHLRVVELQSRWMLSLLADHPGISDGLQLLVVESESKVHFVAWPSPNGRPPLSRYATCLGFMVELYR